MNYTETLTDAILSHHIESYWKVEDRKCDEGSQLELLLPTCTFNIIFVDQVYSIKTQIHSSWSNITPGIYFIGQTSGCIYIKSNTPISILGVRFKPFAFSTLFKVPAYHFSESITPLSLALGNSSFDSIDLKYLFKDIDSDLRNRYLDEMMSSILSKSMALDEKLRAQLNYIMDRQGNVKIKELTDVFNTSKVTLRKHFINKVGLSPKKACQIWRMNRILQLKEYYPNMNLTSLSLEAGFYDQAHFIKDFKSILGLTPKKFFGTNTSLVQVANLNISRRFSNQYDPRV